jgi:hypothetical protein
MSGNIENIRIIGNLDLLATNKQIPNRLYSMVRFGPTLSENRAICPFMVKIEQHFLNFPKFALGPF